MKVADLQRALHPLKTRLANMLVRGVVSAVTDSGGFQRIKLEGQPGEIRDAVERLQQYGFTGHPTKGAELLAIALNGDRGHLVVLAVDDRNKRPKDLAPGETAQWSDFGDRVWLRNGEIRIGTPTAADPVVRKSDLEALTSKYNDLVSAFGTLVSEFNAHAHTETTPGGPAPTSSPVTPSTASASSHSATASEKVKIDG